MISQNEGVDPQWVIRLTKRMSHLPGSAAVGAALQPERQAPRVAALRLWQRRLRREPSFSPSPAHLGGWGIPNAPAVSWAGRGVRGERTSAHSAGRRWLLPSIVMKWRRVGAATTRSDRGGDNGRGDGEDRGFRPLLEYLLNQGR